MPNKGRLIWNNLKSTTGFKVSLAIIFVMTVPYAILTLFLGLFSLKVFGALIGIGFLLGFAGTFVLTRFSDGVGDFLFNTGRKVDTREIDQGIWLDRVKKISRDGDYATAAQIWKELLEGKMVTQEKAAIELARIYEDHLHRPLDALFWYRKTLSAVPNDHSLAIAAREGIGRLGAASQISENDYLLRAREIEAAIERNDLHLALKKAKEFQGLYPQRSGPLFLQARIAAQGNNHILAAAHYRQVLELEPEKGQAAFNLAMALQEGGRDMEARTSWQDYLRIFGKESSPLTEQAEQFLAELNENLQSTLSLVEGDRPSEPLEVVESHPVSFEESEEKK